jgi:hypothetical protein
VLEDYEGIGMRLLKDCEGLEMEIRDLYKSMTNGYFFFFCFFIFLFGSASWLELHTLFENK